MKSNAKRLLVGALVVVVAMAFRVSWNALHDIARSVGADDAAAALYPFVVDGLMALALVATLVLDGDGKKFALRVLAGYTLASLALNYVHGLLPAAAEGERMQLDEPAAHYALVLLATSLPVGAIYFGSDLVAKVLHHTPTTQQQKPERAEVNASTAEVQEEVHEVETLTVPPASPAPDDESHNKGREAADKPSSLVICGDKQTFSLAVPPAPDREDEAQEAPDEDERLSAEEARNAIGECWVQGISLTEAAARSTRSTSYVFKVYKRLEADAAEAKREPSKELVLAGAAS